MSSDKIIVLEQKPAATVAAKCPPATSGANSAAQWKTFLFATLVLAACFCVPFYRLAKFAWSNELYSYILLVPFISWYLARLKKPETCAGSKPWRGAGMAFLALGLVPLGVYFFAGGMEGEFEFEDGLALLTLAFSFFFFGAAMVLLGREAIRQLAFPLGMMIFLVPMPVFMRDGIEIFLQYGSAYVAHGMFKLSGLTFVRNGLVFILPGLPEGMRVAPECSGIHSTLILFITSLLAGYLFLNSPWKRAILALAVVPLGLLRNGFRVFTIGQLCVHYGPKMIDSVIHRKGGPLFFALSLIPFFALLAYLYNRERRAANPVKS